MRFIYPVRDAWKAEFISPHLHDKLQMKFLEIVSGEPYTEATMDRVVLVLQPYLDHLVALQQIHSGKIVCDHSINRFHMYEVGAVIAMVWVQQLKFATMSRWVLYNEEALPFMSDFCR